MLSYARTCLSRASPKGYSTSMAKAPKGITKSSRTCVAAFAPSAKPLTHFSKAKYSTNPYLKINKPATETYTSYDSEQLIAQVPPIVVEGKTACCDGGDGPLGHPRVFISLHLSTLEDAACCEYCGLRFISTDYLDKQLKAGRQLERGTHFLEPADLPDWEYNAPTGHHH